MQKNCASSSKSFRVLGSICFLAHSFLCGEKLTSPSVKPACDLYQIFVSFSIFHFKKGSRQPKPPSVEPDGRYSQPKAP